MDLMTFHAVQIILDILFARHWQFTPPKQRFSNFGPDHARVLVFGHNNFICGASNLRSHT